MKTINHPIGLKPKRHFSHDAKILLMRLQHLRDQLNRFSSRISDYELREQAGFFSDFIEALQNEILDDSDLPPEIEGVIKRLLPKARILILELGLKA